MNKDLLIRGENIQRVYDWYLKKQFLVNRKYQRKLVWSLQEKEAFIDSIRRNISVPLFLVATKNVGESEKFEIIDGMQRLNALFSFIEGDFYLKTETEQGYFDLSTMASTKELLDNNKLIQKKPILSRSICSDIVNYQLPFSVSPFKSEDKIEEIFRRINSFGRQLSNQDLRQAGAIGKFPDLVRIIASQVRRDSSPDILELDRMKEISLSNNKLPYGININNTFWVKQNIVTDRNMRISRDEEVIAYILIHILLSDTANPSASTLDKLYRYDLEDQANLANKAENEIDKLGFENIQKWFQKTFDEFEMIANRSKKDFRTLLFGKDGQGLVRSFQVLFLAFYELRINQQKQIKDYDKLIGLLNGIGNRQLNDITNSEKWNGVFRNEKIKSVCAIIENCFEISTISDPATDNWVSKFENLLMQSRIEQQQYDFKIGLHELDTNSAFNEKLFKKIIKTLTAMANNAPKKKGYVIIGIADDEDDKNRYETIYSGKAIDFNGFNITGIQDECLKKYKSRDEYFNKLKQRINTEPIEDYTKSYITRNMRFLQYFEKDLLVFEIESTDKPLFYDKQIYERQGANAESVDPLKYAEVFKRF